MHEKAKPGDKRIGNKFSPGRPKGKQTSNAERIKAAFAELLEGEHKKMGMALERVRKESPKDYLELCIKISERFVPKITATSITDLEGNAMPLQIILPQNPNLPPSPIPIDDIQEHEEEEDDETV